MRILELLDGALIVQLVDMLEFLSGGTRVNKIFSEEQIVNILQESETGADATNQQRVQPHRTRR